ncbi:hypothetical protein CKAN_02182400 [Cinnamomum micranthum f. kanehirae]|uniref:BTB/POZ domain-containing protein n=1 Tax=Cinnamomum micranthum f. kanehirae TaxID=337451 RepID=A0A3S3N5A4_9MAGN|nr:hypothetical protein CKAN_02182400 [Cinnamomum micranthum f. kanehirae]
MATTTLALAPVDKTRPPSLLHSIFMSTVKTAANSLFQVASNTSSRKGEKWKASDHFRYMFMLWIWLTVWVLRVLIDNLPSSVVPRPPAILDGLVSGVSSPLSSSSLLLDQGFSTTSRKYQFAMAMAERIVDENTEDGDEVVQEINRTALSTAFRRTTNLLYNSINGMRRHSNNNATWPSFVFHALPLPLGGHLISSLKGILGSMFSSPADSDTSWSSGEEECVLAEKLTQELAWMVKKMRACSIADEAILQWLCSLCTTTAILFRELAQGEYEASRQVKFRMLMLWLPLFSYASNGLTFPILTEYERAEMERVMEELIMSLPPADQEVILNNWLQDYAVSSSDWPNLHRCYEKWCRSSRKLLF